jgi:hypothetical protein
VSYQNPRYFAAAFPPLLLVSWMLLRKAGPGALRLGFLGMVIGLQIAANYSTLDPVSIAAFGNTSYGRMRMHCRYWGEGGCWSLDQLVYNQQFLEIQAAQDAVFRALRPSPDATFVVGRWARDWLNGPRDPETFERTERDGETLKTRFVTFEQLAGNDTDPEILYVLDFPRVGATGLPLLRRRYKVVSQNAYGTSRLKIPVTVLRRRDAAP